MDHTPAIGAVPATSQAPRLTVLDTGDRRWKRLIEQANAAYPQGDIPLARAAYDDALTEAEKLFETAISRSASFPAPVIYNIPATISRSFVTRQERRNRPVPSIGKPTTGYFWRPSRQPLRWECACPACSISSMRLLSSFSICNRARIRARS